MDKIAIKALVKLAEQTEKIVENQEKIIDILNYMTTEKSEKDEKDWDSRLCGRDGCF